MLGEFVFDAEQNGTFSLQYFGLLLSDLITIGRQNEFMDFSGFFYSVFPVLIKRDMKWGWHLVIYSYKIQFYFSLSMIFGVKSLLDESISVPLLTTTTHLTVGSIYIVDSTITCWSTCCLLSIAAFFKCPFVDYNIHVKGRHGGALYKMNRTQQTERQKIKACCSFSW